MQSGTGDQTDGRRPMEVLASASPAMAEAFSALRSAASAGPLDDTTVELIVVGALAAKGHVSSVVVHARRLLEGGVSPDAVRQAIVAPLGAAADFSDAVAALRAVDALTVDT